MSLITQTNRSSSQAQPPVSNNNSIQIASSNSSRAQETRSNKQQVDNSLLNRAVSTSSKIIEQVAEIERLQKELEAFHKELEERKEQLNQREEQLNKREEQLNQRETEQKPTPSSYKSQEELAQKHFENVMNFNPSFSNLSSGAQEMIRRRAGQITYVDSHPLLTRINETPIAQEAFLSKITNDRMELIITQLRSLHDLCDPNHKLVFLTKNVFNDLSKDIKNLMAYCMLSPKFNIHFELSSMKYYDSAEQQFSLRCKDIIISICKDAKQVLSQRYPNYFGPLDGPYNDNPAAIQDFLKLVEFVTAGLLEQVKTIDDQNTIAEIVETLVKKQFGV